MAHKHPKQSRLRSMLDGGIAVALLALFLEVTAMTMAGPAFHASVYGPLRGSATENRFQRQVDTTSIKSPTPKSFTACERRAMRVKNMSRRNQILTICHARQNGN